MSNNSVEYLLSLKDKFSSGIRSATVETEKLNKSVNQTQNSLNGMGGMIAGLGATIGATALANEMLNVGSTFESAEIGLKTLLGSAEAASKVFNQLKQDATQSPFDFETLVMGNRALISAGLSAEKAREDFSNLSNAIAATGGGNPELQRMVVNMQQIKNLGKASALDVKEFAYAGVNMYSLLNDYATKYNLTLDKENITYEQLSAALKNAASEGGMYFNGLSNLANSTSGKLSNLKDAFKNTLYDVFVALKPVIDAIVVGLTSMFNMIKSTIDFISEHKVIFGIFGAVLAAIATGMAVIRTQIILTTIAQWALNTATGVFDALSGNWVALAAGAVALAAGIYMAANAQESLNNELSQQTGKAAKALDPMKGGKTQTQTTSTGTTTAKGGTSTNVVESRGVQNFNIDINKLVENINIQATTIKEGASQMKDAVAQALIEAVNDFQLMATK
jgi:hypothetical protein